VERHSRPCPAPVQSAADVETVASETSRPRHIRPATQPLQPRGIQRARVTATPNDEHNSTGAKPPNPCAFVGAAQAQAIAGGLIKAQIAAPLGPTCIYKLSGSRPDITLAVESMSLPQVARQMRKTTQLSIGGHTAYCGTLGREMLFLSLSGGRVLNVTAPCALARQFAAAALSHVAAV